MIALRISRTVDGCVNGIRGVLVGIVLGRLRWQARWDWRIVSERYCLYGGLSVSTVSPWE